MRANCCICDKAIEPTDIDPCGLTIYTNAYAPRRQQKEQDFFCHSECFQKLPGVGKTLFILDEDHATIGEIEDAWEDEEERPGEA